MVFDHQVEAFHREEDRLAFDGNQHALRVQRTRLLAISGQPLLPIGTRQAADQSAQVLRQCELREADFVIDRDLSRREGDLDRAIDALIRDIVCEAREW